MVEVVAAEVRVAVGGFHLEDTVAQLEDGDIEGTAAEVKHGHLGVGFLLVQTVSQSGCGRLVDDTFHVQTRNLAGLLGGLTLRVAEVSRHRDDGFRHLLTEVVLRRFLHLLQNHSGDLLRGVRAVVDLHFRHVVGGAFHDIGHAAHLAGHAVVGLAHETLDGEDGLGGVGDGLTLGGVTDLTLIVAHERHDGRRGSSAFAVGDDDRLAAFHHRNT